MHINDLTSRQLKVFHNRLARDLGVKFYSTGLIARILRIAYDRMIAKYLPLPPDLFELRPFCFKNRIFLTEPPGSPKITPLDQVMIAVHECTHALRIRDYPGEVSNWYGSYFTNDHFRAMEEAATQEAECDVYYWLFGKQPELNLTRYLVGRKAAFLAEHAYNRAAQQTLKKGRGWQKYKAAATAQQILIALGVERVK